MFLLRIILASVFILTVGFSAQAQKQSVENWNITDYFRILPEKYKTFSGDFSAPSKETTIIDEQNGYAAYIDSLPEGEFSIAPIFEMVLFKSQTKPALLVVTNTKSDSSCTEYETFFLQRIGNDWANAKTQVLPPMNSKMFWDERQASARLTKIIKESAVSYHFKPPRQGTRMKVSLEICDYLSDDAPETARDELQKIIESAKTIYLDWDKQNGKFIFAK